MENTLLCFLPICSLAQHASASSPVIFYSCLKLYHQSRADNNQLNYSGATFNSGVMCTDVSSQNDNKKKKKN